MQVVHGNLIKQDVDGIVNSANSLLQHNGGVARVIAVAAGPSMAQECVTVLANCRGLSHGRIAAGSAVKTGAGVLPYRAIIHAVPPHYHDQGSLQLVSTAAAAYILTVFLSVYCIFHYADNSLNCSLHISWLEATSVHVQL